jgi:hypothetical protein
MMEPVTLQTQPRPSIRLVRHLAQPLHACGTRSPIVKP